MLAEGPVVESAASTAGGGARAGNRGAAGGGGSAGADGGGGRRAGAVAAGSPVHSDLAGDRIAPVAGRKTAVAAGAAVDPCSRIRRRETTRRTTMHRRK